MGKNVQSQIEAELAGLDVELQQRVLEFVRKMKHDKSTINEKELSAFAGTIAPHELEVIRSAIEEGCEQVDMNEW